MSQGAEAITIITAKAATREDLTPGHSVSKDYLHKPTV